MSKGPATESRSVRLTKCWVGAGAGEGVGDRGRNGAGGDCAPAEDEEMTKTNRAVAGKNTEGPISPKCSVSLQIPARTMTMFISCNSLLQNHKNSF